MLPRIACLLALLAAAPAFAEPPPPGGVADLTAPRALGLSAAIGTASGNEAIFLNPGAIAARRRYTAETSLLVERRSSDTTMQLLGGTVVDSQTGSLAAGFSYQRAREGDYTGNLFHLALAAPVADRFFLGASGKWLSLDGPEPAIAGEAREKVNAVTVDAGFLFQVSDHVSLGAAGYNLVPIDSEAVAPRGAGVGLDLGSDRLAHLTLDWRTDLDRDPDRSTNRWSAGVEVLLGKLMPLRAGYIFDETLDTQWWSAGVGLVTRGLAIDVGYRQSIDSASARVLGASVKLNVFD